MSYSDFLIITGPGSQTSPPTGSSIANNTLANPLTSSTSCRGLNGLGQINTNAVGAFFISSSISSSAFANIPETKSVSLRIWGRALPSAGGGDAFGLIAKSYYDNSVINGNNNASYPVSGYEFAYDAGTPSGSTSNGFLWYSFGGYGGSRQAKTNILTGLSSNVWIGLRMDIVPVKANKIVNGVPLSSSYKDIITLYTASVSTPDTWQQVFTTELLTTDINYVPWDSYTTKNAGQQGASTLVATSSWGFCARTSTAVGGQAYEITYFDDFKIFVEDAF